MKNTTDIVAPIREVVQEIQETGGETYKYCYQCGKCDVVCPWNRVRKFSIRKIVRQATFGLPEIELEDIWRCTTCGTCPVHCPRGVEQIQVGVSLRRIASSYGVFPGVARSVQTVGGSLATVGNPMGEKRETRGAWADGLSIKKYAEGMDLLYFVGCYGSYDPRMIKVARATTNILDKCGVVFGTLGSSESCCGESIRRAGNEVVFRKLARENIKTFIDHGVKRILVSSPHCYQALANDYAEFMVNFEVLHITQLLLHLIDGGKLVMKKRFEKKVTYHDPCYLGRHNRIFDQPREILSRVPGLELVEMSENRMNSLCCGGGGGRIWMDTPKGERFADIRLEQAGDVHADVLATSCPYCMSNFEESRLALDEGRDIEIKDITEIIWNVISEDEI